MSSCALHYAVLGGSAECLLLLLRFLQRYAAEVIGWSSVLGDMLEWKDGLAMTPLSLACSKRSTDRRIISLLLRVGANPKGLNTVTQRTAFMSACEVGNIDAVTILLAQEKSNREMRIEGGGVAGSTRASNTQTQGNNRSTTIDITRKKCCPADRDISGITAIMLAAAGGHVEIVEMLLQLGTNVSYTTDAGDCIFHFAARGGNIHVLQLLIDREATQWRAYRADIEKQSLLKSMRHRPKIMRIRNYRGHEPQQIAEDCGHHEFAEYIKNASMKLYAVKVIHSLHLLSGRV